MSNAILEQVQQMVDQLSPLDQVRLLEYLTPRIMRAVESAHPPTSEDPPLADAWREFFRIGDAIAALDTPESETLTAAVLAMRR